MIKTPITHCPIRVISDIDDTVKSSDIVSGARVVIQNVFVRELQDNVIPCMGEWYRSMFQRGERLHYVVSATQSNVWIKLISLVSRMTLLGFFLS
jgi:phosphatidate phosphatase APP1